MKLQCTATMDDSYFNIGVCYDAVRGNTGEVLIIQDEEVSDIRKEDAWIAFEGINFCDGTRFVDIEGMARFREVIQ